VENSFFFNGPPGRMVAGRSLGPGRGSILSHLGLSHISAAAAGLTVKSESDNHYVYLKSDLIDSILVQTTQSSSNILQKWILSSYPQVQYLPITK